MAGYIAWLTPRWDELRVQAICLGHMIWARAVGGCLVRAAADMPPVDVLGDLVQQEIARRQAVRYPAVNVGGLGYVFNVTFTTTSW